MMGTAEPLDAALVAWAVTHGPDHLRYAAKRGYVIRSAVLDTMAKMLADALSGRVIDVELIHWQRRKTPHQPSVERYESVLADFARWQHRCNPPVGIAFEVSPIVRVEEQPLAMDPMSILKYSGVVVTLVCSGAGNRFVLVNLEAGAK